MTSSARSVPPRMRKDGSLPSTQWSVVLGARSDSEQRHQALERLCAAYWPPIYGYLRRHGSSPADAEDLTQSFFVHLVESDFLDRPDPDKGRFRGYLIGALRHFLSHDSDRRGARKRGGGIRFVDWSTVNAEQEYAAVDRPELDPAEAYEKSWALTMLNRALRRLETEQSRAGRARQFDALREFLSAKPTAGDYSRAAETLGTARTTVAVLIHRLNQRYAELVKLEVAATVQDPGEVPQEMHHLLRALRR